MKKFVNLLGNVRANAKAVCAQKSARREAGFTAMELFVVIIVGLAIFIAAASQIGKLFGGSASLEENRNIQELVLGAKKLRSHAGYPTNVLNHMESAGLLPKGMTFTPGVGGAAGTLKSSWNGAVTLAGTTELTVTYNGVTKETCSNVFGKISSMNLFKTIKVGNGADIPLPDTNAAVLTACNALTTASAVVLTTTN